MIAKRQEVFDTASIFDKRAILPRITDREINSASSRYCKTGRIWTEKLGGTRIARSVMQSELLRVFVQTIIRICYVGGTNGLTSTAGVK